jgi:hypothetical protein
VAKRKRRKQRQNSRALFLGRSETVKDGPLSVWISFKDDGTCLLVPIGFPIEAEAVTVKVINPKNAKGIAKLMLFKALKAMPQA